MLARKRELYKQFIGRNISFTLGKELSILLTFPYFFPEEMVVSPSEPQEKSVLTDVTFADHPLNLNPDSQWQTYFKDNEVLLQIDKDVRSVYCCIHWYDNHWEA